MNPAEIADWLRENKINYLNTCGRNDDYLWVTIKEEYNVNPTYMCEMKNTSEIRRYDIVETATIEDAKNIAFELQQIEEFSFTNYTLE